MPTMDAQGRWISDDGRFFWDGSAWQAITEQPRPLAAGQGYHLPASPAPPAAPAAGPDRGAAAAWSLGLGIFGCVAWLLPVAGVPVAVIAIVLGGRSVNGSRRGMAIAGLGLGVVALVLGTVNGAAGVYLFLHR